MKKYKLKSTILYVFIGFLILSNLFFYSRYIKFKENTNYIENMTNKISLAATTNDIDLFRTVASNQEEDFLVPLLGDVAMKGSDGSELENYIAIKYNNGNTLFVQITQNEEGIFLIKDMFFLEETTYNRLFQ